MDYPLACHPAGQGSNPDATKDFSAPILWGTPPPCALCLSLSLTMPVVMCSRVNTCLEGGEKRRITVKS